MEVASPLSSSPASADAHRPPIARPPAWQEAVGQRLFLGLSPRLPRVALPSPPNSLAPFEALAVPRGRGAGTLAATWYPARAEKPNGAKGAVLLLHPWMEWGQTYFHRRGRIPALRRAGYHVLTPDLPGFGWSGPPDGFFDRDVADCLRELQRRAPRLPLHVWGVSSGGYWAHPALARTDKVTSAFFEDVSPHLLEWSWRTAPWGRPFYLFFRKALPAAYRYLDIRRHAESFRLERVAYVSGAKDRGVRPTDTETLAHRAGGEALIIEGAGHLQSIKRAGDEVLERALAVLGGG